MLSSFQYVALPLIQPNLKELMGICKPTCWTFLVMVISTVPALALTPVSYDVALRGEGGALTGETLSLGVNAIAGAGNDIWIGTSNGLGHSPDSGDSWEAFFRSDGLGDDIISCVDAVGNTCWAGCISTESEGTQYVGAGISITNDGGKNWRTIGNAQGLLVEGKFKVAWDILLASDYSWVATWTDGVGRSADGGNSWTMITPREDDQHMSYHTYSFAPADDYLWVGTENGIARTPDDGATWQFFDKRNGFNGLFYPTIHLQSPGVLWGGTGVELQGGEIIYGSGAVLTQDNGSTWQIFNTGNSGIGSNIIYDITSIDSRVFFATPVCISYTDNSGLSFHYITSQNGLPSDSVYSLAVDQNGVIWAGTGAGLAKSEDGGITWTVVKYVPDTGAVDMPLTYAYPSPFSPRIDGSCTIVYSLGYPQEVSILIYDFSGELVKTLLDSQMRGPGTGLEEKWYGVNDRGEDVANGIYFYVIKVNNEVVATGRIGVLE